MSSGRGVGRGPSHRRRHRNMAALRSRASALIGRCGGGGRHGPGGLGVPVAASRCGAVVCAYPSDSRSGDGQQMAGDTPRGATLSVGGYVNYLEANAAAYGIASASLARLTTVRRRAPRPDVILGSRISLGGSLGDFYPLGFRVRFAGTVIRCAALTHCENAWELCPITRGRA